MIAVRTHMERRTTAYFNYCTRPNLCVAWNIIIVFPWQQLDGRTDGSAAATSSGNSRCNLYVVRK